MESTQVSFVVEEASCSSCAQRVRQALSPFATVESIDLDPDADAAVVRAVPIGELNEAAVNEALAHASEGAGHAYRVKPGTWRATG